MDFICIDFETADQKSAAACSLGITLVENNIIQKQFCYLINPELPIAKRLSAIHGITDSDVADSPTFPTIWAEIEPLFRHYPVVAHHAGFDGSVLKKMATRYNLSLPCITYYCTLKLAQINFPDLPNYTLPSVCDYLKIPFKDHHSCDADSLAAAKIMIHLASNPAYAVFASDVAPPLVSPLYESTCDDEYICDSVNPIFKEETVTEPKRHKPFDWNNMGRAPDYEESTVTYNDGDAIVFDQKKFVITGDIVGYSRSDLQQIIKGRGGYCVGAISSKVDYLVVGMQNKNIIKDVDQVKSLKIINAEKLRKQGYPIRIISDEFFVSELEAKSHV